MTGIHSEAFGHAQKINRQLHDKFKLFIFLNALNFCFSKIARAIGDKLISC